MTAKILGPINTPYEGILLFGVFVPSWSLRTLIAYAFFLHRRAFHCRCFCTCKISPGLNWHPAHISSSDAIYYQPEYPFLPPKMKFVSRVYHPNISSQTVGIPWFLLSIYIYRHGFNPYLLTGRDLSCKKRLSKIGTALQIVHLQSIVLGYPQRQVDSGTDPKVSFNISSKPFVYSWTWWSAGTAKMLIFVYKPLQFWLLYALHIRMHK